MTAAADLPSPTDQEMADYGDRLVRAVAELATCVRDEDPAAVARRIQQLLRQPVPAGVDPVIGLIVALAAAVPDDQPLSALLAWTDPDGAYWAKVLAGHAAYVRLRAAGQDVPPDVAELQRQYDAELHSGARRLGNAS